MKYQALVFWKKEDKYPLFVVYLLSSVSTLTLVLLNPDMPFANNADPHQLASEEANWIWICTVCHLVYEFVSKSYI